MMARSVPRLVVAAVMAVGCGRVAGDTGANEAKVEGDELIVPAGSPRLAGVVTEAAAAAGPDSLAVPGRIAWNDDATVRVFAPFAGRVTVVVADVGRRVRAGDTLALVSSPDFGQAQADARRAATDFALAERTAVRTHDLFAHGVVARRDVEAADADVARASTELARARARIVPFTRDTSSIDQVYALRAPLGGVVVDRSITPGEEVRPDQILANAPQLVAPLFTITDPARLWLLLDLPEGDAGRLHPGATVAFRPDASSGPAAVAQVTWVSDAVDPVTRTVKARANVNNATGRWRAEMLVTAQLPEPVALAVTVPANAVICHDSVHVVFVQVAPGRVRRARVDVGAERGGRLTIARGLAPGDRVVTTGAILIDQLFARAGKS